MLTREKKQTREQVEMLTIESLVPKNHVLRDIDCALNFDFIYELVEDLYCKDNGRPSVDPVVLFKIIFIKYLFGIRSIRQTIKEIEVNMAYRWFLGYGMTETIPHFTTFGKNYERRFADSDVFEKIFEQKQRLIDVFLHSVYVYDDKMLIIFNYKDGEVCVTFDEVQEALGKKENHDTRNEHHGSPLNCLGGGRWIRTTEVVDNRFTVWKSVCFNMLRCVIKCSVNPCSFNGFSRHRPLISANPLSGLQYNL